MRNNSLYYALFFALWQLSCGDLSPRPAEPLPAVVIATQEQIDTLQVFANRYIVLFKALPGLDQIEFVGYRAETVYFSPFLNEKYHYDSGIEDIRMISSVKLPALSAQTLLPLDSLNWQRDARPPTGIITEVRFASNELAAAHLHHWHERGDIYFAEPVYVSLAQEEALPSADGYAELHTQYNQYQTDGGGDFWWHDEINLADALNHISKNKDETNGDTGQKIFNTYGEAHDVANRPIIAVFDSGIDYDHPALKHKMFNLKNHLGEGRHDFYCGDDEYGCNTTNPEKGMLGDGRARPWGTNKSEVDVWGGDKEGGACPSGKDKSGQEVGYASCSHGTHVAGIIAADGKVGANTASAACKTAGVCPFCKILNIRVLAGVGAGGPEGSRVGGVTDTSILNGLKYVHELWKSAQVEIRVINASIGKFHRSRAVALLIENLKNKASSSDASGNGVLVVGAAGNEDTMARTYPAALDKVLAVSATGPGGRKSRFSNFGLWVDIAAPGGSELQKICSTVPGESYRTEAGTSMATPVVAGVAGLVIAVRKQKISADEIENILLFNSNPSTLYPDKEKEKEKFKVNQNRTHYLAKLDHTEFPVPLLGAGLLDAAAAIRNVRVKKEDGELVFPAEKMLDNYPDKRVDFLGCGTIAISMSSYPLLLLLLLPLLFGLRCRCRSSCT